MAVETYNAGVKEYRQTYWMPQCTPLDTDILAVFKITPQPGVDREEAAAAESSTGTWTTVWTDLLTDLDYYEGRAYKIEDVPGDDTCFYAFIAYPIDLFEEGSVVNVFTSLVGNVYRFKDFDQPYAEVPKSRPAGMTGQLSTRMGGAIRHAAHYLRLQKCAKRLLLVITDGEPADVDVRDPQYLRYDAKKAVEEAAKSGVITYCMSLDPRAGQYVSRIFGARNYMIVDHVERLPERLPLLYAGLTRSPGGSTGLPRL